MDSSAPQRLEYVALTDVGCVRDLNEDSLYQSDDLWLVADGMGGHACGEVASQIAIDIIPEHIGQGKDIRQAVTAAHRAIIDAANNGPGQKGMGTTAVVMQSQEAGYQIGWVGDSRAYLWHRGRRWLEQLSEDHSFINRLINAGLLSREDAQNHPQKHMITQCLGSEDIPSLQVDVVEREWGPAEVILLCSDGLSDELSDPQIGKILLETKDLNEAGKKLVEAAKANGGHDNVSVILVASPIATKENILTRIRAQFTELLAKFNNQ